MSANPNTEFKLVSSVDMTTIDTLNLVATNRTFKPVFNGAGTFDFVIPLDCRQAYLISARATGVAIERNTKTVWSGGITNITKSAESNTMTVTATGWLEEFERRYVRKSEEPTLAFSSVIGGQIVKTLMDTCNAQTDSTSTVRPLHLTFGTFSDTQVRSRTYHVGDNYGASISEMSTIENGVDFHIDHATRVLSTVAPDAYQDLSDLHFGYGVQPFNLADAVETTDGTTMFNRESVVTTGGVVAVADDPDAIGMAGVMLEEWTSLSDVADATIAGAYANAELLAKSGGLITYQLTPAQYGDVPRPYDDFEWGDKAYLSVSRGALQITNQAVRLFAGTIAYSDQGDEVLSELEVALG